MGVPVHLCFLFQILPVFNFIEFSVQLTESSGTRDFFLLGMCDDGFSHIKQIKFTFLQSKISVSSLMVASP